MSLFWSQLLILLSMDDWHRRTIFESIFAMILPIFLVYGKNLISGKWMVIIGIKI